MHPSVWTQLRGRWGHVEGYAEIGGEARARMAPLSSENSWAGLWEVLRLGYGGSEAGTVSHGSQGDQEDGWDWMREGSVTLVLCVPEGHHNTIFRKWYV